MQSNSYTTRLKRNPNEKGHIFVTHEEFAQLNDICAYTEILGNQYGATSEQVDSNDLYVIDVAGIDYFKEHYKGSKKIKVIYIDVPRIDRYLRMTQRGDNIEDVLARVHNDDVAFANAKAYADYIIENKNVDYCVNLIADYISKYKEMVKENE